MAQIDPKDIDYSPAMREFFADVAIRLVNDYHIREDLAKRLIERYFSLDVTPLERVVVMHRGAERIARELAESSG